MTRTPRPTLPTDASIDALAEGSISRMRELLAESDRLRTRAELANRRRFSGLFRDPAAIEVTITLTDEVMRIHSLRHASNIFRHAATNASVRGFGLVNAFGLKLLGALSRIAPSLVIG